MTKKKVVAEVAQVVPAPKAVEQEVVKKDVQPEKVLGEELFGEDVPQSKGSRLATAEEEAQHEEALKRSKEADENFKKTQSPEEIKDPKPGEEEEAEGEQESPEAIELFSKEFPHGFTQSGLSLDLELAAEAGKALYVEGRISIVDKFSKKGLLTKVVVLKN